MAIAKWVVDVKGGPDGWRLKEYAVVDNRDAYRVYRCSACKSVQHEPMVGGRHLDPRERPFL